MALRVDDVDLLRDRVLVERFQAGDGAAFDELYQRYRERLLRFCMKRVSHRETAEEIAQEAFTRALGAMATFTGERSFYPWVTVIASRLCVDHYRRESRVQSAGTPEPICIEDDHDAVVAALDSQLISKAMGRLRFRHQDVLRLREVEGLTYQEIADQFGISASTVDALLFRARRALRREFEAVGGRLAAVPLVAGLARAVSRVRARVSHLVNLSPAATAAAVVSAAAAIAALSFSPAPPPRPAPAGRSTGAESQGRLVPAGGNAPGASVPAATGSIARATEQTTPGASPASSSTAAPTGTGSPLQGLVGPAGIVNPQPLQNLLPTPASPGLPTVPAVPSPVGSDPVNQTVNSVNQQLSGNQPTSGH